MQDFINTAIGVSRDIRSKELRIYTDFGRCCRPLLIVQNQRLLKKKKDIDAFYDKVSQTVSRSFINDLSFL